MITRDRMPSQLTPAFGRNISATSDANRTNQETGLEKNHSRVITKQSSMMRTRIRVCAGNPASSSHNP